MITAKEARQKVESLNSELNQKQLKQIENAINKAIDEGRFETYLPISVYKPVGLEIVKLGYVVTDRSSQRDGSSTKISW